MQSTVLLYFTTHCWSEWSAKLSSPPSRNNLVKYTLLHLSPGLLSSLCVANSSQYPHKLRKPKGVKQICATVIGHLSHTSDSWSHFQSDQLRCGAVLYGNTPHSLLGKCKSRGVTLEMLTPYQPFKVAAKLRTSKQLKARSQWKITDLVKWHTRTKIASALDKLVKEGKLQLMPAQCIHW